MWKSGAMIATAAIITLPHPKPTRKVHRRDLIACFVVVAGDTVRSSVALPFVTATAPTTVTATAGCAWPFSLQKTAKGVF